MLDGGLVGLLADPLHIQLEQDVAHGGIGRHHDLVDRLAVGAEPGATVDDGAVDGRRCGLLQLAGLVVAVVGDAVHHVAAAEGLRVLEGGAVHALPGLQIDEVEHHRGGAEIDREPEDLAPVTVHHLAVVEHFVAPPGDEGVERRGRAGRIGMGADQDARAAAERRERHVDVVALDHRLAGEAVGRAQESLRLGAGAERVLARAHLDHAFVAAAVALAGGRHLDRELVGAVEERHADGERLRLAVVRDRAGSRRRCCAFPPRGSGIFDRAELLFRAITGGRVRFPRQAVVEGAVVTAGGGLALLNGGDLVGARESGRAAVAGVAVGAAVRGLLVGVAHDIREDLGEPIQPPLIVLLADLRQRPA